MDVETRRVEPLKSQLKPISAFDRQNGLISFPRVWINEAGIRLNFSAARNRKVFLSGTKFEQEGGSFYFRYNMGIFPVAWSKARREVYSELDGEIWIWNWNDGHLKKRIRYMKRGPVNTPVIFSSDGKWLLTAPQKPRGAAYELNRYDVQTGKKVSFIAHLGDVNAFGFSPDSHFGFSPDGQKIWYLSNGTLHVVGTLDPQKSWSCPCSGRAKWLPNGHIGIVQTNGFQWRLASGRLIRRLPGPFTNPVPTNNPQNYAQDVRDWALSPDGKWIYSAEQSGTIRKWRAR